MEGDENGKKIFLRLFSEFQIEEREREIDYQNQLSKVEKEIEDELRPFPIDKEKRRRCFFLLGKTKERRERVKRFRGSRLLTFNLFSAADWIKCC